MRRIALAVALAVASGCRRAPHTRDPGDSTDDRAAAKRIVGEVVDELMATAHVVAIGENSHGTAEFRRALHDATEVGIERHALGAVLLELGAAYVERLDAYAGGCGPSSLAPPEQMDRETLGILHTPAFLGFLDAVRRHNVAHPDRCVRLVGIEAASGQGPRTGLVGLVEPHLTALARGAVEAALAGHRGWTLERTRDPDAHATATADLVRLREILGAATSWTAGAPPAAVAAELPWWLALCEQRIAMAKDPLQRERWMADNVLFWSGAVPKDRAVLLYAHTFHVAAGPYEFKGREQRPMGTFVRAALGDDYKVVGTTFGEGEFLAMQPIGGPRLRGIHVARVYQPSQPCLEQRLLERGAGPSLVRPTTDCATLGDGCRAMRQVGIVYPIGFHDMALDYRGIDVARAFDVIVFYPWAHADR